MKVYGFLLFTKDTGKNLDKNIRKYLSEKYSQKLLDNAKKSATDAFKTVSKKAIHKTAEAMVDSFGNKIAYKLTKVSKSSHIIILKQL